MKNLFTMLNKTNGILPSTNIVYHEPNIKFFLYSSTLLEFFPPLRLDFEYLKDLPVLVLDVNDDFKNDRIKQQAVVDKVKAL